jgi:hypothetical protein
MPRFRFLRSSLPVLTTARVGFGGDNPGKHKIGKMIGRQFSREPKASDGGRKKRKKRNPVSSRNRVPDIELLNAY